MKKMHITQMLRPSALLIAAFALASALTLPSIAQTTPLPPLSSTPNSPLQPGKFVWADLVTDDLAAAKPFYTQLFGWTFSEVGNYSIASNGDHRVAGMFQRARPVGTNAKPRWFGYISVTDVSAVQKAVNAAGGKVLAPARKVADRGEQAVFIDAEGAMFGVIKSSSGDPQDAASVAGDWIWVQLFTRDAKKASDFYSKIGGYKVMQSPEASKASDYVLASGGHARAAVLQIAPEHAEIKPNWLPFVRVKNITDTLAQARQHGGSVLIEPRAEAFDGKIAVIADPTGAAIGVLQWSEGMIKNK